MIFRGLGNEILEVVKPETNNGVIPRVGEHVTFDGKKEYITIGVVHDYASGVIDVHVRPATSSDRTFLEKEGYY